MNGYEPPIHGFAPPETWSDHVESTAVWTLGAPIGQGESQSKHITRADGVKGVAKPALQVANAIPRAAHEKIGSDLARALGFSVPPVILWTDPATGSYYSISAWAYRQALTWKAMAPAMSTEFRTNAAQSLAEAIAFHTLIGDTDRHDQNTLVNTESTPQHPEICFIDHAFSMTYSNDFKSGIIKQATHSYAPAELITRDMLAPAAKKVESLAPATVEMIVRRIPEKFLSPDLADMIVRKLTERRLQIGGVLAA